MAPAARAMILFWAVVLTAGAARGDDALTSGDLGWLSGNLNLAADSPAVLDLTPAQKSRLHALIARHAGSDRKRQAIVQFLTEATDGGRERTPDEPPPAGGEVADRPR